MNQFHKKYMSLLNEFNMKKNNSRDIIKIMFRFNKRALKPSTVFNLKTGHILPLKKLRANADVMFRKPIKQGADDYLVHFFILKGSTQRSDIKPPRNTTERKTLFDLRIEEPCVYFDEEGNVLGSD